MTDILADFRSFSNIQAATIADNVVTLNIFPKVVARYNRAMDTEIEITAATWVTGDADVDLALCYLSVSIAYIFEYMDRMVRDKQASSKWEQLAYGIMMEIDPSKVGKRPEVAGGEYYVRYENRGKPYSKPYIKVTGTY